MPSGDVRIDFTLVIFTGLSFLRIKDWKIQYRYLFLRPKPIPTSLGIPLRGRLEEAAVLGDQMFLHCLFIKGEAQAGCIRHWDVAILDDWLWQVVNKVIPERYIRKVMFQRDEVLGGCSTMHASHCADWRTCHMHCHADAVLLREVADLFRFENTAACGKVGMDHIHGVGLQERQEAFFKIYVFTRTHWSLERAFHLYPLLGKLPGHHIFEPGEVIRFQRFA